jgi:hypothetical protein
MGGCPLQSHEEAFLQSIPSTVNPSAPSASQGAAKAEKDKATGKKISYLEAEIRKLTLEVAQQRKAAHMLHEQNLQLQAEALCKDTQPAKVYKPDDAKSGAARASQLQADATLACSELSLTIAQRLQTLMRFAIFESCDANDALFKTGFTRGSRTHRVLVPFWVVQECFKSALNSHMDVLCQKAWIQFDATPNIAGKFWQLKAGRAENVFDVSAHSICRIGMLELVADFHRCVQRFVLRPPQGKKRDDTMRMFLKEWQDVLWGEKVRQFQAMNSGASLPPLPPAWGDVDSPYDMPCALWLVVTAHARSSGSRDP